MSYVVSLVCGVFLEVFLFSKNEWDRRAPHIVQYALLTAGSAILLLMAQHFTLLEAVQHTTVHGTCALTGLFGSMVIYRIFFHRLRAFPGPFAARISAFWIIKQSLPDLRFFVQVRSLHDRYGDFVRIRPREISICHPDAIVDVHGPRNKILKGEFYDQMYPSHSLQMSRDMATHSRSRRYWDKAFQNRALLEYTPWVKNHCRTLMDLCAHHAASGKRINASETFTLFTLDLVSELMFGESWNMLVTGQVHPMIVEFLYGKKFVGVVILSIWVLHLFMALPPVKKRMLFWLQYYADVMKKRKEMTARLPDMYTYLSQAGDISAEDAQLAVVAGSDTVSYTLSNALYLLSIYPQYQEQLHQEIRSLPNDAGVIDDRFLADKPWLLGIINETLRLYPPVPSGVQRLTPPEGAYIAGRYIPGDTVITTPTYSIHRDQRAFVQPDDFVPERWFARSEMVIRKDAFFPFSYGAYNCAGKPLAMMQLRMVISMLVKRFRISIPKGKEAICRHFIEHQGDCFVMHIEELPLSFEER